MTEYTSLTSSQWASLIASAVSAVKGAPSLGPGSVKHAPANLTPKQLARTIDHTLLKLDATEEQIVTLCQEARTWGFRVRQIFFFIPSTLYEFRLPCCSERDMASLGSRCVFVRRGGRRGEGREAGITSMLDHWQRGRPRERRTAGQGRVEKGEEAKRVVEMSIQRLELTMRVAGRPYAYACRSSRSLDSS